MSWTSHRACAGVFSAQPARIWLTVTSAVIQTDSDRTPARFTICFHLTESFHPTAESRHPRLSMNVPVQSTSVTACEFSNMSSDACCARRCRGGYLCCRIGHRSPPLCLCLSLLHLSLPHHPPLTPSSASHLSSSSYFALLVCTHTLVKSAHSVLRSFVSDVKQWTTLKRRSECKDTKERSLAFSVGFKTHPTRMSVSHHCHSLFFLNAPCAVGVYRARQTACYNNYTLCSMAYHLAQRPGACVSTGAGQNCFT